MQQFKLVLQHEKRKFYDRFALFFFTLNGVSASILLLYAPEPVIGKYEDLGLLVAALAASICCIVLVSQKKANRLKSIFILSTLVILVFWVIIGNWWIGLLVTGLILLYHVSQRALIVIVSEKMIRFPSFPIKKINWIDLYNLVMKDGLLTIDFKNNKIIQQMTDTHKTNVDEKEFNEFCKVNLRRDGDGNPKPDYGGAIEGLSEIISSLN